MRGDFFAKKSPRAPKKTVEVLGWAEAIECAPG